MLIDCYECGHRISNDAASCPQCGAPVLAGNKGIKAHQILGVVVMIAGLGIFIGIKEPGLTVVGGLLMIFGLISALI